MRFYRAGARRCTGPLADAEATAAVLDAQVGSGTTPASDRGYGGHDSLTGRSTSACVPPEGAGDGGVRFCLLPGPKGAGRGVRGGDLGYLRWMRNRDFLEDARALVEMALMLSEGGG